MQNNGSFKTLNEKSDAVYNSKKKKKNFSNEMSDKKAEQFEKTAKLDLQDCFSSSKKYFMSHRVVMKKKTLRIKIHHRLTKNSLKVFLF